MSEIKFIGGTLRIQAYQKLKVFLANPGKFCLIVLGDRGSGKHFAIESAFKEIKSNSAKELCLEKMEFVLASTIPLSANELDELFKKHQNQTLVIEDVERLSYEQQDLLFTALSTSDGKFGVEKKNNLRIVFTSSKGSEALREDENHLQGLFWDRISQLLIELPSYKTEADNIVEDFHSTWAKMKFENTKEFEHFAQLPRNPTLEKFLQDYADKFEGGFRDLDKLACMYFNYRILLYRDSKHIIEKTEKEVVYEVKKDFIGKSQLHSLSTNDLSVFQIQPGFSMNDLNAQFRIQVRKWALKEHGTLTKAADKLGLSQSILKLYVHGKATKKHRDESKKLK